MPNVIGIIAAGVRRFEKLFLLGCDGVRTRKQEVEFIWSKPVRLTLVRCLFILVRYLAVLIHIGDIVLAVLIFGAPQHPPHSLCISMLLFRATSCQSMFLVLHLILMLRVFALYNQNLRMGGFLLALIVIAFAASTGGVIRGFLHADIEFDGPCFPKKLNKNRRENPMLIVACKELFIQLVLHGLTWKRTMYDLRGIRIPSQPQLLSVLHRDGLRVFMGILVNFDDQAPDCIYFGFGNEDNSQSSDSTYSSDEATISSPKEVELTVIESVIEWDTPWDTSTILGVEQ
ncbi:hypothetical protein D9757_013534 [Collybiopsis confluens]|uniref:DUF6533 domain-containing protein n=1 Tax=Collybiopsis confluens TaxID=2823264 RepID=A0A8H5FW02_9AGAR|nr:hypothetical protein D9757_013534 [Collybiopsis confluens]